MFIILQDLRITKVIKHIIFLPTMRIVVNTKLLQANNIALYRIYIYELIQKLISQHQEHEFILLLDDAFEQINFTSKNIIQQKIKQKSNKAISIQYWYNISLPLIEKKYKADIVLHFNNRCSLTIKTPQIVVLYNTLFLEHPQFLVSSEKIFYKLLQKKILEKANRIITLSEYSKQVIQNHYKLSKDKIFSIPFGVLENNKRLSYKEQENIKQQYTDGCEYFVFSGTTEPLNNILTLLKAFSIFKKRLHSNMKLLLLIQPTKYDIAIKEKLKTYKYREDIVWLDNVDEPQQQAIISSAYALILTSYKEEYSVTIINAMQNGIPIAYNNTNFFSEITNDAALSFDTKNENDIAQQMMLLYKDENLRNQLIEKGIKQTKLLSWNKSAESLWKIIEQKANK
ncbi:MAG: glycosyltransferase family 4 protein [Chitinophagales bacterium]|nr:glycosyltransferase family 4 protein [Chitinophagales bacterium]